MSPSDPVTLLGGDVAAALAALRAGHVTPVELVRASIAGLERRGDLNAVVEVRPQALSEAEASSGPLAGLPVVVKDCFVDGGRPPTLGSNVHARWLDGTAVLLRRLRSAGAVVVAYANLHEWMVGTTSLVSAFGPVVNPTDPGLIAGGSSGGSAAALAAGLVPLAIGSDAGGSIRIPAACCGVVGLKPSWGLVPTEGFVDHPSPIDHVGPMARSVEDVGILLEILSGRRFDLPDTAALRLGVAWDHFIDGAHQEVGSAVLEVVDQLRPYVASVREVSLAGAAEAGAAIGPYLLRDVAGMLDADGDDLRARLQEPTARVVALGAAMDEGTRSEAELVRARVGAGWDEVFGAVDVVVTPTLPGRIAGVAERAIEVASGSAPTEISYVAWNAPMDLGGVPCLSLPCAHLADGQSVSLSLTAARGDDGVVLSMGTLVESLRRRAAG